MKPQRIFIFYAVVLLLLSIIAILIPEQGIGITGNLRITFLSFPDMVREDTPNREENVKRLLAVSTVTDDPEADPEVDLFMLQYPVENPSPEPMENPLSGACGGYFSGACG